MKTNKAKKAINTRKKALALADALELEADSLYPCDENLQKHAALMARVENLRALALKMTK